MSDHFGPIGLRVTGVDGLRAVVDEVAEAFVEELRDGSESHLRWTDASGASLAMHLEHGQLVCVTPFFAPAEGLTRWRVRTTAPREESGCAHCGGADCDLLDAGGETISRATVQWLHFGPYRRWLKADRTYELEVATFAHRLQVFADEAAFGSSEPEGVGSLKLASNAFLPAGMFGTTATVGAAAEVLLAGRVSLSEVRRNTRGGPFWRIRVETLPGALDVVATPDPGCASPHVGSIALVEGWLVGRPVDPPPRRGVLQRLGLKR